VKASTRRAASSSLSRRSRARSVRRSTRISTTAITSTMASGACVTGSARSFDMNGMAMKGTSAAM
jgi:hypothetical protein